MSQIECVETANARIYKAAGYQVEVKAEQTSFIVYDDYNEPCATIERPSSQGRAGQFWTVFDCRGEIVANNATGPKMAFRQCLIWKGL